MDEASTDDGSSSPSYFEGFATFMVSGGRPASFWISHMIMLAVVIGSAYGFNVFWERYCETRASSLIGLWLDLTLRLVRPLVRQMKRVIHAFALTLHRRMPKRMQDPATAARFVRRLLEAITICALVAQHVSNAHASLHTKGLYRSELPQLAAGMVHLHSAGACVRTRDGVLSQRLAALPLSLAADGGLWSRSVAAVLGWRSLHADEQAVIAAWRLGRRSGGSRRGESSSNGSLGARQCAGADSELWGLARELVRTGIPTHRHARRLQRAVHSSGEATSADGVAAAALLAEATRPKESDEDQHGDRHGDLQGDWVLERSLQQARRLRLLFLALPMQLLCVFGSRHIWGRAGSLISLLLAAFCPSLLAHSWLLTEDFCRCSPPHPTHAACLGIGEAMFSSNVFAPRVCVPWLRRVFVSRVCVPCLCPVSVMRLPSSCGFLDRDSFQSAHLFYAVVCCCTRPFGVSGGRCTSSACSPSLRRLPRWVC